MRNGLVKFIFGVLLLHQCAAGFDARVAVVDIQKVFMDYTFRTELLNQLAADKKQMDQRLQQLKNSLNSLQSDLDTMSPVSKSYEDTQMKLIEIDTKIKITTRQFEIQFERKRLQMRNLLLNNILKEIETYAKENKIDLVFSKSTPSNNSENAVEPLLVVLYNDPKLDVTEAITHRLNNKKN